MKLRGLVVLAMFFTLLVGAHVQAAYVVGDEIADFTLNDSDGTPVSLSDYDGKIIFLVFWTDT